MGPTIWQVVIESVILGVMVTWLVLVGIGTLAANLRGRRSKAAEVPLSPPEGKQTPAYTILDDELIDWSQRGWA